MGWSGANAVFNPVARSLIEAGVDDTTKRKVLGDLIGGLQEGDWDTEDESLEDFLDDPAIVQAFADHDVHLSDRRCCRRELGIGPREALLRMRHEDIEEDDMARAVDAFAHHLADQIRTDADLREAEGERRLAIYGRELADLIRPEAQR
ncbi:hypothetical protein ACFXKC_28510 [Streptomyces sp. NPDC059340]|uniref:hypothetical protein n=1 Tax=Streptomyces sp. NPDC059340 TaxID=3346806 RepID=UPI0036AC9D8A